MTTTSESSPLLGGYNSLYGQGAQQPLERALGWIIFVPGLPTSRNEVFVSTASFRNLSEQVGAVSGMMEEVGASVAAGQKTLVFGGYNDRSRRVEATGGPQAAWRHVRELSYVDLKPEPLEKRDFWQELRDYLHKVFIAYPCALFFAVCSPAVWCMAIGKVFCCKCTDGLWILMSIVLTLLAATAYYVGQLAVLFQAVYAYPGPIPGQLTDVLASLANAVGGWYTFVIASVVCFMLPVSRMLDILYYTRSFVRDDFDLQRKITSRMVEAFEETYASAEAKPADSEIVIVAHSFGVVVAVKALHEYLNKYDDSLWSRSSNSLPQIRLVTLGNPLKILMAKSPEVRGWVDSLGKLAKKWRARGSGPLPEDFWTDFRGSADWFCTEAPTVAKKYDIAQSKNVFQKVSGESHTDYFSDPNSMIRRVVNHQYEPEEQQETGLCVRCLECCCCLGGSSRKTCATDIV